MKKKILAAGVILLTLAGIVNYKPFLYACSVGADTFNRYAVSIQGLVDGDSSGIKEEKKWDGIFAIPRQVPDGNYQELYDIQSDYWHFSHLSQEERAVYTEILYAIVTYHDEVFLSTKDDQTVAKCFQCVLNDHPEIFYVTGYHYTNYLMNDQIVKICISVDRTMPEETRDQYQKTVEECADQILSALPEDAEEYDKVKYVYDYVIRHTEYDPESENNQNILSVFLNGSTVCQGYTKAVQYLLQRTGVNATAIMGKVNGERHSWNLVEVNGLYYYLDATWGDSSYYAYSGGADTGIADINYDYFLITYDMLSYTHEIDNVIEPPPCFSLVDNFYVREGLYFNAVSDTRIKKAFQRGYEDGWNYVTLKCSSKDVYAKLKMRLLNNGEVFQYLKDKKTVAYVDNMTANSISFYL